jgi:hypothetical protein
MQNEWRGEVSGLGSKSDFTEPLGPGPLNPESGHCRRTPFEDFRSASKNDFRPSEKDRQRDHNSWRSFLGQVLLEVIKPSEEPSNQPT